MKIQVDVGYAEIRGEYSESVANYVAGSDNFKSIGDNPTDIDIDTDTQVTIDDKTLTSPAIESKNLSPNGPPPELQLEELRDKLSTWAASGEDELVVSVNKGYLDEFGDSNLLDEDNLENEIQNRLISLDSGVDADIDTDVNVNVVTHEQIEN